MPEENFTVSIYDQIRANRWRTIYLFAIFPIIILGIIFLGLLIFLFIMTASGDNSVNIGDGIYLMKSLTSTYGFWILAAIAVWSAISYFFGASMIMAFAEAKPIDKKDNPKLFRAVENASIAAGLPKTPDIYIIKDSSLNAFATGTNPKNAKVAISEGLLNTLDKDELEGVMAHEIGHILNRDIRVMLLAITLVGAIEMVGEMLIRVRGGGGRKNGTLPLILIGILFLTVGVLVGTLTKLAISREREYLADATGSHLTSNPLALASALEKIARDSRIEVLDAKTSIAGLCIADPTKTASLNNVKDESTLKSLWQKAWSTHPPIQDRIKMLRGY
jgi:heat shock protein HtpX